MLRAATDDDLEPLLDMMVAFNQSERIPFSREAARAPLVRLLGDRAIGRVLLVEDGGAAAGYLVLTYGFDLEFGGRDAFLTEVWIEPAARGRGVGTRALAALDELARADGCGAVHLAVNVDNAPAKALYRKAGFAPLPRELWSKRLG